MLGIVEKISDAIDSGCTDVEAMNLATDLMKMEMIKIRFPGISKDSSNELLEISKNAKEIELDVFSNLSKLSTREKECYLMHYITLMSFQKIADILGVSKGTVNTYIRRAREKLNNE